jgi:predicted RNA-binding Zn-ribbon protein involved in translation (DUF1610 family)
MSSSKKKPAKPENRDKFKCPECNEQLERYPKTDIKGAVERYGCPNNHTIAINPKTQTILSVTIPFTALTHCPECGLPLVAQFDRVFNRLDAQGIEDGSGLIRFVRYNCPNGHSTDKRQTIQKLFRHRNT